EAVVGGRRVGGHGRDEVGVAHLKDVEDVAGDVRRALGIEVEGDVDRHRVGEVGLEVVFSADDGGADRGGDARVVGVVEDDAAAGEGHGFTVERHVGPRAGVD